MNPYFGGRRRRLKRPAWWYVRGCSMPGCTIPLWPAGENLDEDGCDMRIGSDMAYKNISYSQICFWCKSVLCRYHLSAPIDFCTRWSYNFQQDNCYPPVARLCSNCIMDIEIEYIMWLNDSLTKGQDS